MSGAIQLSAWIAQRRKEANTQINIHTTRLSTLASLSDLQNSQVWLDSFLNIYAGRAKLELLEKLESKIGRKYKIVGERKW
jgi:hypothetical protein